MIGLIAGWRVYLIAGGVTLAVALGAYIMVLRASNAMLLSEHARLESELNAAARVAADNARELERARAEHLADMLLLEEHNRIRLEETARSARVLEEIERAPESDDGPIAPVLKRALDRLRVPVLPGVTIDDSQKGRLANPKPLHKSGGNASADDLAPHFLFVNSPDFQNLRPCQLGPGAKLAGRIGAVQESIREVLLRSFPSEVRKSAIGANAITVGDFMSGGWSRRQEGVRDEHMDINAQAAPFPITEVRSQIAIDFETGVEYPPGIGVPPLAPRRRICSASNSAEVAHFVRPVFNRTPLFDHPYLRRGT